MKTAALQDFRVLSMDVTGTLIDFERGILDCLTRFTDSGAAEILSDFALAEKHEQDRAPQLPFTELLGLVCRRMGLPDEAGAALRASIPRWPAFPDAVAALAVLRRRYRLVALTNVDRWAMAAMAATLGEPFHDAVTAEDVGVNKPDPQMFAYCRGRQSHHGHTTADWLHVAQSQYHDIGIAKRLGFTTCWIERRHGRPGFGATPEPAEVTAPDLHYRSLAELAAAIG
ncbi:HAD-IA family hydrolase [Amycolatopsis nigrescens]|uniref:HAD-IA family hydrolase n=1 Tax=Amycolatopsis nigrescens TaxID=381445 RepID=UPI0003AB472E|nr:HAD-IA family hydrolase [Amycolatopsis nigrescens]